MSIQRQSLIDSHLLLRSFFQCVMLQETAYAENKLYAKIGCMDRQTFTSTKLQLHVYTDDQCSVKYDDGFTSKRHSNKGYEINGYTFSTRVSFRPPFYTCMDCAPATISGTFNKKNTNWYDDDYISQNGQKNQGDDAKAEEEEEPDDDDDEAAEDDYADDQYGYMNANDDVNGDAAGDDAAAAGDDAAAAAAVGDDAAAAGDDAAAAGDDAAAAGDDAAAAGDDGNAADDYYAGDDARRLAAPVLELTAAQGQLEVRAH